jgi:hypothetical protein
MIKRMWCLPLLIASISFTALPQCYTGMWSSIVLQCPSCQTAEKIGLCRSGSGFQKECGDIDIIDCDPYGCEIGSYLHCTGDSAQRRAAWSPANTLGFKPRVLASDASRPGVDCRANQQEFLNWTQMKLRAQAELRNRDKS